MNHQFSSYFLNILNFNQPNAVAEITGSPDYPDLYGSVLFFQALNGTMILVQMIGLPCAEEVCSPRFLGFHIHEGSQCSGNAQDPFVDAGAHYNPYDCPHPEHSGDLPPLLISGGITWSVFYTSHIKVSEILNHTVVVHSMRDDFVTQPSGDSGKKIGCGTIQPISFTTDLTSP